jgi:hypothetical protein
MTRYLDFTESSISSVEEGLISISGDASVVPKFFASFDVPTDAPALTVR